MAMSIATQLGTLDSQKAFVEGERNTNPFTVWQTDGKWTAQPWCDSFAQWGAVAGGYRWPSYCQFSFKGDAYTPYTVTHAKMLGLWREKDYQPQPGDQVLFDWNHNNDADHIGTVVRAVDANVFVTIEGNYRDRVMYVKRDRKYVLGFVALSTQAAGPGPAPSPPPAPPAVVVPTAPGYPFGRDVIHASPRPIWSPHIASWQAQMKARRWDIGKVDGLYGSKSAQVCKAFQEDSTRHGWRLTADGILGPQTWRATWERPIS